MFFILNQNTKIMNRAFFFLSGMVILLLASCTGKADKPAGNESLANTNETVIYEVSLELNPESPQWMGNIDRQKLVTKLFSQVEHGEVKAYGFLDDPQKETIDWENVLGTMDATNDTIQILNVETGAIETNVIQNELRLNDIKSLIFIEEWALGENGQLKKEVLGIAPVRYLYSAHDSIKNVHIKRIPFVAYYGDKRPPLVENY